MKYVTKLKSQGLGRGVVVALFGASAVAGATLLAACGAAGDGESEEPTLGMAQNAVQIAWVGTSETSTTDGVNLIKASSQTRKGKSTGAIRIVDGAINASCGATFISNRRAVTAAHCVENYSTTQTFTLEQYNTTNLNLSAAINQSTVTGLWPNYTRPVKISNTDGYLVAPYTCKVERRCSINPVNCPAGATNSDIALVYCSGRLPAGTPKNWVPVATSDTSGATVDVWWFHELLNLDTSNTPYTMPYSPDFNWGHYGHYNGEGTESTNFHYTQNVFGERLQLFPLRSTHSKQNVLYRSSGALTGLTTNTNVPVCHGTSGSGVFRGTADELLGVVDTGGLAVGTDYNVLCSDMNAVIGSSSMQYSSRQYTAIFGSLPEVTAASERQ